MRATLPIIAALLCTSAAYAETSSYELRPFQIPSATSVAIAAITDAGVAAGNYVSPAYPNGAGFAGNRGGVTTMALLGQPNQAFPREYVPSPTAMNNHGTVVGTYLVGDQLNYFAWRNGVYTAFFGLDNDTFPPVSPYVGTNDRLCYNEYSGDGIIMPYSGTPATQSLVPANNLAEVTSINAHGAVAGQYVTFIGTEPGAVLRQTLYTIETLRPAKPQTILPPGAQSAAGGWINDVNQVAGSYQDKAGIWHGFVYKSGAYTTFDFPTKPDTLTTQGISQEGSVVGVYTKGNTQFAWVYEGATVTRLKPFPLKDTVHVATSHFGKFIAVSDTAPDGTARSWLAVPASVN